MAGDDEGIEARRGVEQRQADVLALHQLDLLVGQRDEAVHHLAELAVDLRLVACSSAGASSTWNLMREWSATSSGRPKRRSGRAPAGLVRQPADSCP
jgi:hypothetical protein